MATIAVGNWTLDSAFLSALETIRGNATSVVALALIFLAFSIFVRVIFYGPQKPRRLLREEAEEREEGRGKRGQEKATGERGENPSSEIETTDELTLKSVRTKRRIAQERLRVLRAERQFREEKQNSSLMLEEAKTRAQHEVQILQYEIQVLQNNIYANETR